MSAKTTTSIKRFPSQDKNAAENDNESRGVLMETEKMGADKIDKVRHTIKGKLLSVEETAKALGISIPTVYKLFDAQLLKNFHIGRRRLVSLSAIDEFINNKEKGEF